MCAKLDSRIALDVQCFFFFFSSNFFSCFLAFFGLLHDFVKAKKGISE